jgi:hypothetical protein
MSVGIPFIGQFLVLMYGKVFRCFINGLGRLNLMYIFNVRRSKFYMHLIRSSNTVLYNLFWLHCCDYFSTDDCLNVIHLRPTEAIDFWHQAYADECNN